MRASWLPMLRLAVLALLACAAGPPSKDPDWPCMQRLVPTLTPGTIWGGHDAAADWRSDPKVADLVARVAPRSRPRDAGAADLKAFAATVPAAERPATLAMVFAGLVDETNAQRAQVIDRLHGVARRQRELTGVAATVTTQLHSLPEDAPAADREEIASRRAFIIRDYEEVGRTIQYACDVPVQLEARLGTFAQVLQAALDSQ